jgi:hypothetical protein
LVIIPLKKFDIVLPRLDITFVICEDLHHILQMA